MNAQISTKFWNDPELTGQPPEVRLTFVWLMSNSDVTCLGLHRRNVRQFVFDTGLGAVWLDKTLAAVPRLAGPVGPGPDGVNWIWVRNYIRDQIGDGEKLVANTFGAVVLRAMEGLVEPLRGVIFAEYPVLVEAIQAGMSRASRAERSNWRSGRAFPGDANPLPTPCQPLAMGMPSPSHGHTMPMPSPSQGHGNDPNGHGMGMAWASEPSNAITYKVNGDHKEGVCVMGMASPCHGAREGEGEGEGTHTGEGEVEGEGGVGGKVAEEVSFGRVGVVGGGARSSPGGLGRDLAEIPTKEEVVAAGRQFPVGCGAPEAEGEYCEYFHGKWSADGLWLDGHGFLKDWRWHLRKWWGKDRVAWLEGTHQWSPHKKTGGAGKMPAVPGAGRPAWAVVKELEAAMEEHPGNPLGTAYEPGNTEERVKFRALKKRAGDLRAQSVAEAMAAGAEKNGAGGVRASGVNL